MKIFITGISSGIGKALCQELVGLRHTVWGIARRGDLLEELKEELNSDSFFYSICDITTKEAVFKVISEMEKADFLPDVVVLNAGIEKKDSAIGYQSQITQEVFSVNFFGALIWIELFLKKFIERNSGHFIAVSSIFAQRPDIDSVAYCASKSALSMAFRSLHLRYYKKNIIFTNIYFGPVDTSISSGYRDWRSKLFFFIISPKTAAQCIIKVIKGKQSVYYFPFLVTLFVRLTSFLSDIIFFKLTKIFRR